MTKPRTTPLAIIQRYVGNEDGAPEHAALIARHARAMKTVDPLMKVFWNDNGLEPAALQAFLSQTGDVMDGAAGSPPPPPPTTHLPHHAATKPRLSIPRRRAHAPRTGHPASLATLAGLRCVPRRLFWHAPPPPPRTLPARCCALRRGRVPRQMAVRWEAQAAGFQLRRVAAGGPAHRAQVQADVARQVRTNTRAMVAMGFRTGRFACLR